MRKFLKYYLGLLLVISFNCSNAQTTTWVSVADTNSQYIFSMPSGYSKGKMDASGIRAYNGMTPDTAVVIQAFTVPNLKPLYQNTDLLALMAATSETDTLVALAKIGLLSIEDGELTSFSEDYVSNTKKIITVGITIGASTATPAYMFNRMIIEKSSKYMLVFTASTLSGNLTQLTTAKNTFFNSIYKPVTP